MTSHHSVPDVWLRQRQNAEYAARGLLDQDELMSAIPPLLVTDDPEGRPADVGPSLPDAVREAVSRFSSGESLDGLPDGDVLWVVLTEALSRQAVQGGPSAARIDAMGKRLHHAPPWAVRRWEERCAANLLSCEETERAGWIGALSVCPKVTQPAVPSSSVSVVRSAAPWALQHPFQLWDEPAPPVAVVLERHPPFRVLVCMGRERWFRAADEWLDGRLVQAALYREELREDLSACTSLLREASPSFDDGGAPTGRATALVLSRMAVNAAEAAANRASESGTPDSLAVEIDSFATALVTRSDGVRIGAALASWLVDDLIWPRSQPRQKEIRGRLLDRLCRALATRGVSIGQYRALAAECRERAADGLRSWHSDIAAVLATSRIIRAREPADRAEWHDWLRSTFGDATQWRYIASDTLLAELLPLLGGEPDPIASCKAIFVAIETSRRRGEFGRTLLEHGQERSSLLLLVTLAALVESGHGSDPLPDLEFVCDRAWRIAMTDASVTRLETDPRDVVSIAIAVGCRMFGVTDVRTHRLAQQAIGDVELAARVAHRIRKTMGAEACAALLQGIGTTFKRVHADLVAWSEATNRLTDLAADLGP